MSIEDEFEEWWRLDFLLPRFGATRCELERFRFIAKAAYEAGAKAAGEWISTKDLMPELNEYVLLMADRYWNTPDGVPEMKVTATGYLADFGGLYWAIFGERGMPIDSFTHWLPIPDGEE